MKLHHIAIWTFRLEELKDFYTKAFKSDRFIYEGGPDNKYRISEVDYNIPRL